MLHDELQSTKFLRILELLYLSMLALSFYLMLLSRTEEVHTVWEAMHPLLIPTIAVATSILFLIVLTSEKTPNKLLLVIAQSILLHSFFSIILPAGDLSGQQTVLGKTRRIFNNTVLHGLTGWPTQTVEVFIYEMFQGANLQAALTTIHARMLCVDVLPVHLFFVPVLWGTFIPIGTFLVTKTLGGSEDASILSGLLVSAFPYATYFGAISVPNSLGFIFFLFSLYFMLRHLVSDDPKIVYWMVAFSFFSFLSHSLTGVVSFSLIFLTLVFKVHAGETRSSPVTKRVFLCVSFLICASLLPLSFIYLRAIGSLTNTIFTLEIFYESSLEEIVGVFFLGELIYGFDFKTILLVVIGPTLALLYMIYRLYDSKRNPISESRIQIQFLFAAFLIMMIDYRIMKLFMSGLPINPERLWVFQDLVAAPFVAHAVFVAISSLRNYLKAHSFLTLTIARIKTLSRANALHLLSILVILDMVIPLILGGWTTLSLSAAYPQVAPLQITSYELEAVKYIDENAKEKYVVIGDLWTIYAGGMIVGIYNPNAFYFGENDPRGYDLFSRMRQHPSPQTMIEAMNQTGTDTDVAYFIISEPRLGTEEFDSVVSQVLQDKQLAVVGVFGDGKLYIFGYSKVYEL